MNPAAASLPAPAVLRRLPPLLRRAWYGLNQSFRQRIAHLEITPDQYSILRWLNEGDPLGLTQRQLTDLMASDPNTITSTLSRMETAGLISRHPHETDRRAHRVRLETPGKSAFKKGLEIAVALQEQLLSAVPEERRSQFLGDLALLADACAAALEKKPGRKRP
jgi:DNA-binding MarR family transcriptional regulator